MNARIALFLLSIAVVCLTTEALLQHSSRVSSLVNRACRTTGTDASNPRISCLMQKADTDGGSPVDSLIRAINDPNFSLGVGVAGIVVLLANRLSQDLVVSDIQSRADIIGVIASSALLLNVLSEQDITARDRDPVSLVGYAIKDPVVDAAMKDTFSLKWLVNTIISSTPATSVAVISQAKVVSAGGVVARGTEQLPSVDVDSMTILRKTIDKKEETYLPDLQILPGKVEFKYLPLNCQSVFIIPIQNSIDFADGGAVVVGTNQAKALKFKDLVKIRSAIDIFNAKKQ